MIRGNGIECEFAAKLLLDVWTRVVFTWTQGDRLSKDGGSSWPFSVLETAGGLNVDDAAASVGRPPHFMGTEHWYFNRFQPTSTRSPFFFCCFVCRFPCHQIFLMSLRESVSLLSFCARCDYKAEPSFGEGVVGKVAALEMITSFHSHQDFLIVAYTFAQLVYLTLTACDHHSHPPSWFTISGICTYR